MHTDVRVLRVLCLALIHGFTLRLLFLLFRFYRWWKFGRGNAERIVLKIVVISLISMNITGGYGCRWPHNNFYPFEELQRKFLSTGCIQIKKNNFSSR